MLGDNPQADAQTVQASQLRYLLLDLCYASICHKLDTSCWASSLMHFLVRCGICPKDIAFRQGPHFSQTLAAFAYDSRRLVYSRLSQATYTPDSLTPSLCSALQGVHESYLHDRADAPMGEILSLLAYALAISKSTTSRSTFVWGSSKNVDTLYYKGEPVSKDGSRCFAQSLVGRANDILKGELLLDSGFDLFSQDLASLKDDITIHANGHSFLTDVQNIIALRPRQQMLLQRLLGAEVVGRHLYTLVDGGNIY